MMHFFIKPKIHLDAFTTRKDVIDYAPVVNGIQKIPTWWKNLPKSFVSENNFYPIATMKGCVGMYDYYSKSVAMPLWSDMSVDCLNKDAYRWQFSDNVSTADIHSNKQYSGFNLGDFSHVKINSPWQFETKEDVNWMMSCPIYNLDNQTDFIFPQGLLNFKYQPGTNIQLFLNLAQPRTFLIPFGTVFLFTPMSEKNVVVHRHLITQQEHNRRTQSATLSTFVGKYNLHNRLPKCPYKDSTK
jgi:hypothetical protein